MANHRTTSVAVVFLKMGPASNRGIDDVVEGFNTVPKIVSG